MLTVDQLKSMPPGTVFATGIITDPRIHKQEIKWIAKRGEIHDWTIYYHFSHYHVLHIAAYGDKLRGHDIIRELVPCDDETFNLYRR